MATTNPVISTISGYVEEHSEELLVGSVLGARSAKLFDLMTGVKGPAKLNYMDVDVIFQDGSACGWQESGSTEFTQRQVDPKLLKVNMAYCIKNLLKTVHQHEVRVAANMEKLPFEEKWTNAIRDRIAAGIERLIYFGDGSNDNEFDGLVKILNAASASTVNVSAVTGTSAYAFLQEIAKAIPATLADPVILVSSPLYREFMLNLVSSNLYHYDPADGADGYKIPGTEVRVLAVNGLNPGTGDTEDYAICTNLNNLVYAVDMEGDEDIFDLWYSKDAQEFRLDVEFMGGTQVKFPDQVVVGKRARS